MIKTNVEKEEILQINQDILNSSYQKEKHNWLILEK